MVQYDPHDWRAHLLDIRGSMVREISARVATCVLWSTAVFLAIRYIELHPQHIDFWRFAIDIESLTLPLTAHTLLGVALSLLLVFRTNASYDRFWEGRKLWGGIVNETRNLARLACVHLKDDLALRDQVVRWTIAFPFASMYKLRLGTGIGEVECRLGPDVTGQVCSADHVPLAVAGKITNCLREANQRGLISDIVLAHIDENVQLLIDYIGACERIHNTPLPFAYVVHLRRMIILYTFSLPFALYRDFGWGTILVTLVVAYILYGIEEIGVTIEDPFEGEDNDIPLESICATIDRNLSALIGDTPAPLLPTVPVTRALKTARMKT